MPGRRSDDQRVSVLRGPHDARPGARPRGLRPAQCAVGKLGEVWPGKDRAGLVTAARLPACRAKSVASLGREPSSRRPYSAPGGLKQACPGIWPGRHAVDGIVHGGQGGYDVAAGAVAAAGGVGEVIVVDSQFVEAEHDLQPGGGGAALVADQLIDAADGTEEPVCLPGQFVQRIAAEVPDGTKILGRKLASGERGVQVASPGLVDLVGEAPEGGRQVGGQVGYGPGGSG